MQPETHAHSGGGSITRGSGRAGAHGRLPADLALQTEALEGIVQRRHHLTTLTAKDTPARATGRQAQVRGGSWLQTAR
jgi:hypothetical protein